MSFTIVKTGLEAAQRALDVLSQNIANAQTPGFRSSRVNFSSMMIGRQSHGVQVASYTQDMDTRGTIVSTGRGTDVALQSGGFFAVQNPDGAMRYTRLGQFSVEHGYLVDSFKRKVWGYGHATGSGDLGRLGSIQIKQGFNAAKATSSLQYMAKLSSSHGSAPSVPFDPMNRQSYDWVDVSTCYDHLGNKHLLQQYFVKQSDHHVKIYYAYDNQLLESTTDGNKNLISNELKFNEKGELAQAGLVKIQIPISDGATIPININYSGTILSGGNPVVLVNTADGYGAGILNHNNYTIQPDGSLMATYTNGQTAVIGRLAIANFANEDGLEAEDGTTWTATSKSGEPCYVVPGTDLTGNLAVGGLESSNVKLEDGLLALMAAQRNYQANAKVLAAENQAMQTLIQAT